MKWESRTWRLWGERVPDRGNGQLRTPGWEPTLLLKSLPGQQRARIQRRWGLPRLPLGWLSLLISTSPSGIRELLKASIWLHNGCRWRTNGREVTGSGFLSTDITLAATWSLQCYKTVGEQERHKRRLLVSRQRVAQAAVIRKGEMKVPRVRMYFEGRTDGICHWMGPLPLWQMKQVKNIVTRCHSTTK